MTRLTLSFAAAALALTLAACGSDDATDDRDPAAAATATDMVTVTNATSRQPAAGQSVAAVYATVTNTLDEDLVINGVTSPVTDNAQLHETTESDGAMSMSRVESFTVAAGDTFVFESGGSHIMLMGIDPATYPTDVVSVTLEFDNAEPVTFDAEVIALDESDSGDHTDHDSHEAHDD